MTGQVEKRTAEAGTQQGSALRVLRFAGAFAAWVIGSGFATGQEILQFVASFGYQSFAILILLFVGFLVMGFTLMLSAYDHKGQEEFHHFRYFCGRIGLAYEWVVPFAQIIPLSILLSGAGATLYEYYGLNHTIGVFLMAAAVLITYYAGFERLTSVVGLIGPVIILFSLFVGVFTLVRDIGNFQYIAEWEPLLSQKQNTSNWFVSGALYVSLNFVCGSVYYAELGRSAESRKEVTLGTGIGVLALVAIIAIMSTAILLNAGDAAALDIPTLFLATKISPALGAVFSITLVLGIYSSAVTGMFVVITSFAANIPFMARHIKGFAFLIAVITFLIGVFSFGDLISIFYPLLGIMGGIFTICVFYRCIREVVKEELK